ncbi:hypothetical protein LSPH24S_00157 [Lysinibacillus sphaericus]
MRKNKKLIKMVKSSIKDLCEFDFDGAVAQANNFPEAQGKNAARQPVSERTAWH